MIEHAILIVMVTFAIGFAWLWFIEQKKKRWAVPIATPLVSTSNRASVSDGTCSAKPAARV
jgi:hypothetical protein